MGSKNNNLFWRTLPGVLIGVAAIITAIIGVYNAMNTPIVAPNTTPTSTVTPTTTSTPTPTPTPTPIPLPEIKITNPKDGDEVNLSINVLGTISGDLPNGRYMWLVVNPQSSRGGWWPQGGRINPIKGRWDREATFGGAKDIGTNFTIAVVLVNKGDEETLYKQIDKVTGIPLPDNTTRMDEIIVKKVGN